MRFYVVLSSLLLSCLLLTNAQARTDINVSFFVAPPAHEAVMVPRGYESCYTVPSGFYRGIWLNAHRVCEYTNEAGDAVWVSGYWQCMGYHHRHCLNWAWVGSHWAHPSVAEFGVEWDWAPVNAAQYDHHDYHHGYDQGYNQGYNHGYGHGGGYTSSGGYPRYYGQH